MKSLANLMPLAGLAACLAGIAGAELTATTPAPLSLLRLAPISAPALPGGAGLLVSSSRDEILARPLFRPDRRPPAPEARLTREVPIPRLSGILIGADQRLALFAAAGGKTRLAGEGDRIGAYRILRIGAASVVLADDQRRLVLSPRFDQAPAGPIAGSIAQAASRPSALRGFGIPERR